MKYFILLFCVFSYSFLYCIEVSGSLFEDTMWSAENNPYHVIGDITVEEGVSLTIEPGVVVHMKSLPMYDWNDYENNAYIYSPDHTGSIFVYGEITAIGTETDSIYFTRDNLSIYNHWGVIRIHNQNSKTEFRHCNIAHSSKIWWIGGGYEGAISSCSTEQIIADNYFFNNFTNIDSHGIEEDHKLLVKNNRFITEMPGIDDYFGANGVGYSFKSASGTYVSNYFESKFVHLGGIIAYNEFAGKYRIHRGGPGYYYRNDFGPSQCSLGGLRHLYWETYDGIVAKNNIDTCIDLTIEAYSDIYFFGNHVENTDVFFDVESNWYGNTQFFNNYLESSLGNCYYGKYTDIYNNISVNSPSSGILAGRAGSFYNNIFIGNEFVMDAMANENAFHSAMENCIYLDCTSGFNQNILYTPGYRNCLFDLELPINFIDLGDNIINENLDAEDVFIDPDDGDFNLLPGSMCIDAGYDGDYFLHYDGLYNLRSWDGDGDGTAIPDIGVFEYGAPETGGIQGYTYDLETGEILSYAMVKELSDICNFDISDDTGFYKISLADGIYDLEGSMVFYQDHLLTDVSVSNGEYSQIDIYIAPDGYVENWEDEIEVIENGKLKMKAYPNPFNPETTINFFTTEDAENAEVVIYNMKGQRVRTLVDGFLQAGEHSFKWDGRSGQSGQSVSSGMYLVRLVAGAKQATAKILLLK